MKRTRPPGCWKTGLAVGICGHCRYPELYRLAEALAREVLMQCNQQVEGVQSEMPYKAGFVLETIIQLLQQSV